MTKQEKLAAFTHRPELRLLMARVLDQQELAEKRQCPQASPFLSEEEQGLVRELLRHDTHWSLFGGYEGANRKAVIFWPEWMTPEDACAGESSPLCAVSIHIPSIAKLTHRDYLGSLMGLSLTREKFGDILVREHGAELIMLQEVLGVLETQWEKVGMHPITLKPLPLANIKPAAPTIRELRDSVASLRLDNVLSAGFGFSRNHAEEFIAGRRVQVNHRIWEKASQQVSEGDEISCRGFGKFILRKVGGLSRKGRLQVFIDRYE